MAFTISTTTSSQLSLTAAEDLGVLTSAGSIVNTAICVLMSGEKARLINDGLIASGNIAVSATNDVQLVNTGRIVGEIRTVLISFSGTDQTTSTVTNSGEIIAFDGIGLLTTESGLQVLNTGLISGTQTGVSFATATGLAVSLLNNSGTIISATGQAVSGTGETRIINSGLIAGNISLGSGNDTIDNRLGEITGTIAMGSGNNLFRGGGGDEEVTAGSGNDILRGGVGDDSLLGLTANDLLVGGEGDDLLNGGLNDDTLRGGNGDDTLIGGDMVDLMNGGRGADTFFFAMESDSDPAQAPDRIEGFSKPEDVIDLSSLTNTPLVFVGNGPLSGGSVASVGYVRSGSLLTVSVDTDGDAIADLVFELTGATALSAANFLL